MICVKAGWLDCWAIGSHDRMNSSIRSRGTTLSGKIALCSTRSRSWKFLTERYSGSNHSSVTRIKIFHMNRKQSSLDKLVQLIETGGQAYTQAFSAKVFNKPFQTFLCPPATDQKNPPSSWSLILTSYLSPSNQWSQCPSCRLLFQFSWKSPSWSREELDGGSFSGHSHPSKSLSS